MAVYENRQLQGAGNCRPPPVHITGADLKWLTPSAGIAAGLFITDPDSSWGMASYHPVPQLAHCSKIFTFLIR